mgnify:CR=1 FL=1
MKHTEAVGVWVKNVKSRNGLQIDTAIKYMLKFEEAHGSVNELRDWTDGDVQNLITVSTLLCIRQHARPTALVLVPVLQFIIPGSLNATIHALK